MHVEVEPAHIHDSKAMQTALEDVEVREQKPEEILGDTHYGSDDNVNKALEKSVRLITPVPGKKSGKDYSGFEFDKGTLEAKKCPEGHAPMKVRHNRKGTMTAFWALERCVSCPIAESCPTKVGARGRRLHYSGKDIRIWLRREYERSDEFEEKYRYRAWIEATNSRYIQMTRARRVRYRGLPRVSFAEVMKALGINLFRTAKYIQDTGELLTSTVNLSSEWVISCTKQALRWVKRIYRPQMLRYLWSSLYCPV